MPNAPLLYDTSSAIIYASVAQTSGRRFGHGYKGFGPANQLNDNRNSQANLPSETPKRAPISQASRLHSAKEEYEANF